MIRSIIDTSVRFRLLAAAIAAGVLAVGIAQLRSAPVDVLPEFTPAYAEVQTEALGLSAEEVEQFITVPLEADLLNGVEGVDIIRSQSVPGLSSIVMVFEPGTDIYRGRQLVQERLTQAHALPNVSKAPTLLPPLSSSSRVLMIGLSGDKLTPIEKSVIARWTLKPRLMGVPGVANVAIWGMRDQELQVHVDPERLRDRNVTLSQVVATTGNAQVVSPLSFLQASTPGTGGFIETPQQRLQVRNVLERLVDPKELGKVTVEDTGGRLRLKDVADVKVDHQPLIGDAVVNDRDGLMLVVEKFPGANTRDVTEGVEAALERLRPGLTGMRTDTSVFRPATYIEDAIENLALTLIVAGALLALALVAFLFNWRALLVCLVTIPTSIVAAAFVLDLLGYTFNAISLAGLACAVAIVVDDAVTAVDNVARRLRQQREAGAPPSPMAIVVQASHEMRSPLAYATFIALLAIVPVAVMEGRPGAFFEPLALSYALAVLAAMVVATTVTPALCALLLARRGASAGGISPVVRGIRARYAGALASVVQRPRRVLLGIGGCLVAGIAMLPLLNSSPIPSFKDRDVLVHLDGEPGASNTRMTQIARGLSRELRSIPGVENVGALNDGRNDVRGDGLSVLTGTDEPLVVRVYGQDQAILSREAAKVRQALAQIDGVVNPRIDAPRTQPTLEIEVDLERAHRFGIKPGDVRRAEATLVQGLQVGTVFQGQKVFDVVVQGVPGTRRDVAAVRNLLIDRPGGGHVRLGQVADVRVARTPAVIERDAVSRRLDIVAGVSGRSLGSIAEDVRARIAGMSFPLEYHAEVMTRATSREIGAWRMVAFAAAAAIAIFLLLQAAFRSWRLAALAFVTLPVALLGGVFAAVIAGGDLSIGSAAGFLALFGIAARNAVVLIRHMQVLEREEGEPFGAGLVQRGADERLAPILATTAGLALLALPFVVMGSRPGLEVIQPMAAVILGGLVTTTFVALFALPALYTRFATPADTTRADEEELMHRWLGVVPEPAPATAGDGAPAPVERPEGASAPAPADPPAAAAQPQRDGE